MRVALVSLSALLASGCAAFRPAGESAIPPDLALTNVRIVGASTAPVTIEIMNGRIASIYPSAARRSRAASELDLNGRFVMPGLFDSHVHLTMGGRPAPAIQLRLVLEGGVTSVRDMAGLVPALRRLASEAQIDSVLSPRIYFAALLAGSSWFDDPRAKWWTADYALGAAPWQHAVSETSDVVAIIAAAKATGATAVKIYANLSRRLVARIAAEARRQDLRVWAHSTVFPASPFDVVAAGVHSVSHATYAVWAQADSLPAESRGTLNLTDFREDPADSPRIDSLLTAMRDAGTVLDATLSVLNVRNDNQGALGQDPSRTIAWTRAFTRRAHAMGVRIVAGTDAMGPGRDSVPIVHYELEDLVQHAGLTPHEAIATATVNAAEMLGIAADYGSVAPGKVADLVVLAADPSIDIRNTRRPLMVLKGGRVVHTRRLP
jgi:imidazolonepropionase-like amidohydrolase